MRVIVYGAGAVGSVIGGRLRQCGAEVALVARPAHVAAIRDAGLTLRTALGSEVVEIEAVTSIDQLEPAGDDVVVITAKTQDTPQIHSALYDWDPNISVVCGTNGVEHERMALRRFARVYAMVIQLPAQFENPGEVTVLCGPTNAILDVGRYPSGVDDTATRLAALIDASPLLLSEADDDVIRRSTPNCWSISATSPMRRAELPDGGRESPQLRSRRASMPTARPASDGSRPRSTSSTINSGPRRCGSTSLSATPSSAGRRGRA